MRDVTLVGAGKIGEMITAMLADTGDYRVTVVDRSPLHLERLKSNANVRTECLDITDPGALESAIEGSFAVLNASPYHLTTVIAGAAKRAGSHYLDLTEDVASTRVVKELAANSEQAFVPQCGLAPGFISIVTNHLARGFEALDSVRMRVGALPEFPSNALNYNLTWSTDGVINEYCEPCDAIVDGSLREVRALEGLEEFSLDGVRYEAFNTSGGLGTLCDSFAGRVRNMNYRTVRYPGHRDIMKALIQDLRLADRRDMLKDILENAVPSTNQDVVLVFVTVSGTRDGRLVQESYANKIYSRQFAGQMRSAIQITTASGICTVLDLLSDGLIPVRGFVRQEDIALDAFLANRFGRNFSVTREVGKAA